MTSAHIIIGESGGGGSSSPGGSDTNVQYNSSGSLAGDSSFTYDGAGTVSIGTALTLGSTPASTGTIRLATDGTIYYRNNPDTADIPFVTKDTGDNVTIGGSTNDSGSITLQVPSAAHTYIKHGGASTFDLSASLLSTITDVAIGSTPASTGTIRLPNASEIVARNAANTADITIAQVDSSNLLFLGAHFSGYTQQPVSTYIQAATDVYLGQAGNHHIRVSSSLIQTGLPLAIGSSVASTTVASTGQIRLENNKSITARNNANNADLNVISTDTFDDINVGSTSNVLNSNILASSGISQIAGSAYTQLVATGYFIITGGATPSTSGLVRVPNNTAINARNAGNSADITLVSTDSSDNVVLGNSSAASLAVKTSKVVNSADAKITSTDEFTNTSTTDATVTSAYTWTIPNGVSTFNVIAFGIKSDSTDAAVYYRRISFLNNAGTVTVIGTVDDIYTKETDATWDCTVDNSTTTGRVRVTGKASTTITWSVAVSRFEGVV